MATDLISDLEALLENERADIEAASYDVDTCGECGQPEEEHSIDYNHAFESEHDATIRKRNERVLRVEAYIGTLRAKAIIAQLPTTCKCPAHLVLKGQHLYTCERHPSNL